MHIDNWRCLSFLECTPSYFWKTTKSMNAMIVYVTFLIFLEAYREWWTKRKCNISFSTRPWLIFVGYSLICWILFHVFFQHVRKVVYGINRMTLQLTVEWTQRQLSTQCQYAKTCPTYHHEEHSAGTTKFRKSNFFQKKTKKDWWSDHWSCSSGKEWKYLVRKSRFTQSR